MVTHGMVTDMLTTFQDKLVRSAFGNCFDVLKQAAYHQIMGESLTCVNSQSAFRVKQDLKTVVFPDENFAREAMQLFTVGLCELNLDGSQVMDGDACAHACDNDDIIEHARAWTGFARRELRGNIESEFANSHIDPLELRDDWRDALLKMGLDETLLEKRCKA